MNRTPVQSSNILSVGYDPSSLTLEVEFKNGTVYQYFDVPQSTFDALLAASSVGQYLNTNVRGVFRFAKL